MTNEDTEPATDDRFELTADDRARFDREHGGIITALSLYGEVDTDAVAVTVDDDADTIASVIDRAHRHGYVVDESRDATDDARPVKRRLRFVRADESDFEPAAPEPVTDGGIIVAGDEGVILEDDDGDDRVDPDDEGVELLTDGGTFVDRPDQGDELIASGITAARTGHTIDVWVDIDGERTVVSGVVASHGKHDKTHVVAFDTFGSTPRRVAVRFTRVIVPGDYARVEDAVLFDPSRADTFTVRRVERR